MTPENAIRLLKGEIVPVAGCTEPAAIAYAFRTLVRHLRHRPAPSRIQATLHISRDAFRNASTAVVPHLKVSGVLAAAAAGLASRANDFNVFSDFDLTVARSYMENDAWLRTVPVRRNGLYVHLRLTPETNVLLRSRHDHIERLVVRGRDRTPPHQQWPPPPRLNDIFTLARARHPALEALALDFITRQVPAEKGYPLEEQVVRRVIGRMTGYSHPVMTITGSGNQGLFLGLPYRRFYADHGETILPALVFSLLAQVHLSHKHDRLAAECGLATKAAPALAAGLAFARGASARDIRELFRDIPARLAPMPCDGAEPACGDKARQALRAIARYFPNPQ
ncbi:MAG: L-serine ammonia-lyase, iron-sulfur-dependent, subunit alpha [Kiritimatiellae bacterium]|nr:L-serine ammonia-lyase, iron-sulfur-dependent, subunit alpha [Kiritimatiellia bacterium]MDD4342133.1 L-serine ammonia-lyase, iron-sulfur-dependent, subunit alpha [Kiritimatiellia bacterium]